MNLGWAYDGVNHSVPRNTGKECVEYLTPTWRLVETCIVLPLCLIAIKWAMKRIRLSHRAANTHSNLNNHQNHNHQLHYHHDHQRQEQYINHVVGKAADAVAPPFGKQVLLVAMTFTLGVEVGFKFATRTVIYILNPCHITTLIQIYLLASNKPSKTVTFLFRIQMNYLNGPLLAFVFPETDNRQLPLEAAAYWIQHALMLIIPIYLLRLGGAYNMSGIGDFSWNIMSYAFLMIYHFGILQIIALPAHINLNHMLCPAIKDPFQGPYYRAAAFTHELLLCTLLCKLVQTVFMKEPVRKIPSSPAKRLVDNKNGTNDSPSHNYSEEIIKTSKID